MESESYFKRYNYFSLPIKVIKGDNMMKKTTLFLVLLVIFSTILIAGCTTQQPVVTSTPTPVPTVTPEITVIPTTNNITVVPTTNITAAPTTTTITIVPTRATITAGPNATQKSIVDTLAADGRFTTLVAALRATQLDSNLSAPGPFTLFAPTDSAFNKLPAGTMDSYLKDPQTYYLTKTLRYHMVNKKLMASDIMRVASINTIQGESLLINVAGGTIYVNGNVKVISTDIVCSNGVIQVVDTVLTPHG
jgi:uncharacterized surface protein with fasciclin (FAS1) repeats